MATKTPNLNLDLPGLGEFTDSWHVPLNSNFSKIDTEIGSVKVILDNSRGTLANLSERLNVGMNPDGTLKATAEVSAARNSFLYGNTAGLDEFSVILRRRDEDLWKAQQSKGSLLGGIAYSNSFSSGKILDGFKSVNGEPAWLGWVANKVVVDGSSLNLSLLINGKAARIRTLMEHSLPNVAGLYYIYAQYEEDGTVISSTPIPYFGATSYVGTVSINNLYLFSSPHSNFISDGVLEGDTLVILSGELSGKYVIHNVVDENNLHIKGNFSNALGSLSFEIRDPLGVTLHSTTSELSIPATGALVVAEATSTGTSVDSYNARHFGDTYIGDWRPVDVGTIPTFEEIWNHRLGTDKVDVVVQVKASLSDDFTETLSLSQAAHNLTPGVDLAPVGVGLGTTAVNIGGTTDPHTHTLSGAPVLSGAPTASLSGAVFAENSVRAKYSRNQVRVRNAVASKLYRDYDGVERTAGFIRVVITKRG